MASVLQYGETCLMLASKGGHMEIVRYLYDVGGKELLMMTDEVSVNMYVCYRLVDMVACRLAMLQVCLHAHM